MTAVAVSHGLREAPVRDHAVPRLELAEWRQRYGVIAGITTREHGFDLGLWGTGTVGDVLGRWQAFRLAFGPSFPVALTSHQVHGADVVWHDDPGGRGWMLQENVDGHATAAPGLLLNVTVADCVPVYLVAPGQGVLALLHAGWRGVAGHILRSAVELLDRRRGVRPEDLVMHCGVAICGPCYEVGRDVARRFGAPARTVDLRAALARQAAGLGIPVVTISPWCSAHDRERFFSHRASGGRDGRMVAYVGWPLA
ncbi:MAG TPA: polyphenol oxidase family protein [Gemmatimonadales bacterium]|nr:polyphenol oxidase family protein [Gemmatimonadales bacterium]